MLSLYLLRHGETTFSGEGRFCGQIDAPLTDEGRRMAERFAAAYGDRRWQAIVTSTRGRTIATASPLAARAGLDLEPDARLDEMSYGAWQGLSKREVAARDGAYFTRWAADPSIGPRGGEAPADVERRAWAAIDDLRGRHADGNVLVVAHKALLRILLCRLRGVSLSEYRRGPDWPVCAVTQIDFTVAGPVLRKCVDVAHLRAPELAAPEARYVPERSDWAPELATAAP